ncbi:MAG: putative membrane protein [Gammaproteobacteria bacterium]
MYELKAKPDRTLAGRAKHWRKRWIQQMVARNESIVVIQTLRNWNMTASFLASTAILISAGLLGVLSGTSQGPKLLHEINLLGVTTDALLAVKVLLLTANFLAAFFSFSMTLRYYNYVALIPTSNAPEDSESTIRDSERYLQKAAMHYSLGMRGYYFAIPIALWLSG